MKSDKGGGFGVDPGEKKRVRGQGKDTESTVVE